MIKRSLFSSLKNRRGAAAVEFAFLAPVLIILTMGTYELAGYSNAGAKFTNATQMLGDLVALQPNSVSHTLLSDFCTGAKYALSPLDASSFKATIASVTNYSTGTIVDWQDTSCNGGAGIVTTGMTNGLIPNTNDSVIIVLAQYTYNAPAFLVTNVIASKFNLTQTSFTRPRSDGTISGP